MKNILLTFVILFSALSSLGATKACELLEKSVKADNEIDLQKINAYYHCSGNVAQVGNPKPTDACVIDYTSNFNHQPFHGMAYLDVANNLQVNWIIFSGENASGWDYSGKVACADIKTYVNLSPAADGALSASVSRAVAWDALFCPKHVYVDYKTTCTIQ